MEKKWEIKSVDSRQLTVSSIEEVVKVLLENRNLISKEEIEEFLNPPHPSEIELSQFGISKSDLENAANLIKSAIEREVPIVIHGDFDADGICATAILWETIYRGLGYENCLPFIPDRFKHGYGLTRASVDAIAAKLSNCQTALLITVDCGITAHDAIRYARSLGFEVLITDHHQKDERRPKEKGQALKSPGLGSKTPPEPSPKSLALRNSDLGVLWTDKICGAGIAHLLALRLANSNVPADPPAGEAGSPTRRVGEKKPDGVSSAGSQFDLVALATIADIQPLLGPNRSFAKYGLEELNQTPRVGLQELIRVAGIADKKIGAYEVGWILAPRLNAAGRLATAMDSLRLLLTKDRSQAQALAAKLDWINRERQEKTNEMVESAQKDAKEQIYKGTKITIVSHESYHEGVIGLLAGKLVEEFYRPSVAIAKGKKFSKGSARSVSGFDIVKALREIEGLLESVGGHPMAAGFTIRTEKISEFQVRFLELADSRLNGEALQPILSIDLEIPLSLISWELWEEIKKFEPFGYANPRSVFLSQGVGVVDVAAVGGEGQHLKLKIIGVDQLSDQRKSAFPAIGFGMGDWAPKLHLGDIIDIVYSLEENRWSARGGWNGRRSLELKIKDLRKTSLDG